MRQLRYQTIADALRAQVVAGDLAPGRLLPSEAALAAAHDASRVTVRRALEALRAEGLVDSRQGFGWFVADQPKRLALGRLGTIEAQLEAAGVVPERRVLDFGFVPADFRARAVLGVDTVLRVRRLNLANGQPFARVTVEVPEVLGAEVSRADAERATFHELLSRARANHRGVVLRGATQVIGAAAASPADAALFEVPVGSPVLRCERVTEDAEGRPVLLAEHVLPALRAEFVVDLPAAGSSMAPSGLRLVE